LISLFAGIVAAVYDCRSSRLSSGFGCTNNSHSGKANEDVGGPAELGIPPQIDKMSRRQLLTPLIIALQNLERKCTLTPSFPGFGCKNNTHSSKANGMWALLPSLVIPPQNARMSTINS
jgi:hypothetical protein